MTIVGMSENQQKIKAIMARESHVRWTKKNLLSPNWNAQLGR